MNTDIYVLQKDDLIRLLERYPAIRSQLMVIADYRYRIATARDTPFDDDSDNPVVVPVPASALRASDNPDLANTSKCNEHVLIYVPFVKRFACVYFCLAVGELKFL